ncbi:sensor histidine kinase [Epidermidibacterium keratini]
MTPTACSDDDVLAAHSKADEQEERFLNFAPYALLAVSTILYLIVEYPGPAQRPVTLAVVVVAVLWEYAWWTRPRGISEERQRRLLIYIAGGIAISAFLVVNGPWFAFYAWTYYLRTPMLANTLARWMAFCCVAAQLSGSQVGGFRNLSGGVWFGYAALFAVNLAVAAGMTKLATAQEERHEERRRVLARVQATNRQLAATLAENAELQEEVARRARESGVADERARLAREIHDTIAQGLAGVVAQLEASRQPGADAARHLDIAHQLARESLGEARRSVQALRPEALTGPRFSDALARLAKQWGELHDMPIEYAVAGVPRALAPDAEVALFRVTQEALANIAKHASASAVAVNLTFLDDAVAIDVRDDGTGFEIAAPPASPGGYGIGVMRERIDRLDGYFEIESAAGEGATVSAVVPSVCTEVTA